MIKAKLSLFQMQIERMLRYTVKLCQASFRITPERLYPIDMPVAIGKLIFTVMHPKVLIKADIHQPRQPSE